jgi:NAD(P)-dependent dehydrogenase (short-subunit alcohol dehydrogenase family)
MAERDLAGRFIVITGANSGIGRVTAEALAARGATLVLAGRSRERTQPVLDALAAARGDARFVSLDLSDLASVRACAAEIVAMDRPIDVLVNNAGLAGVRGVTRDGFEVAFGTNYLGPFVLTLRLWPKLRAAGARNGANARVVNVASVAHKDVRALDFDALRKATRSLTGVPEYGVSKLANVLFSYELARRTAGSRVHTYALHPGVVATDVWRKVPWPIRPLMKLGMISDEEGARTSIYCAVSPEVADDNGRYYDKCRAREPARLGKDAELARRLWEKSVELTGEDLPA